MSQSLTVPENGTVFLAYSKKFVYLHRCINQLSMDNSIDPQKVKRIIQIVIAILSAIVGGITEAATDFLSNLLNF